jgi:YidC/Oxa1 family membrane protein insertase
MSQAMMEMYKKEKVNPLGGCLPILVQIPIFIALYWVLIESVELRQAPFILWIHNLSARDPYFVLPALNAIFMIATQRLTPTVGMDPIQRKMMSAMPIVFSVMSAFSPAGLVLYWATTAGLTLAQQLYIPRKIDRSCWGQSQVPECATLALDSDPRIKCTTPTPYAPSPRRRV